MVYTWNTFQCEAIIFSAIRVMVDCNCHGRKSLNTLNDIQEFHNHYMKWNVYLGLRLNTLKKLDEMSIKFDLNLVRSRVLLDLTATFTVLCQPLKVEPCREKKRKKVYNPDVRSHSNESSGALWCTHALKHMCGIFSTNLVLRNGARWIMSQKGPLLVCKNMYKWAKSLSDIEKY